VKVSVRTDYPDVFKGNLDVEDAGPDLTSARARVVDMSLAWQMNPSGNLPASFYPPLDLKPPAFHALPWIYSGPNDLNKFFMKLGANALPARYAVIHAARTHWRSKSLPELFYRKLAHAFLRLNIGVLVIGGKNDAYLDHPGVVDLRGKTTLLDLREIIRGAKVYIGPDSGPLWVAMSTDTPAIGLFTCTSPENILPPGNQVIAVKAKIGCQGCMHREKPPVFWVECPDNNRYECVNGFDPDEVMAHACAIVSRGTGK
jgi:ADP-heptose:LPS heptosyltransferase